MIRTRLRAPLRIFAYTLTVVLFLSANGAYADAFIPECPEMLREANSFAQACLSNAREFSRVFYPGGHGPGEREIYSAYFKEGPAGSHFALGCALNGYRKIIFLGIYYSTNGENFAQANSAQIRFIDAQGDVGLTIDGASITLLAVRQFGGQNIPLRYQPPTPKNCESALLSDGRLVDANGEFRVEGDSTSPRPALEVCYGDSCHDYLYTQFFDSQNSQIIFHRDALWLLIGSRGNIIVEDQFLTNSCGKWYRNLASTENIVTELCRLPKK